MKTSWCIDLLWKVFWDTNFLVYYNSLTIGHFNWKIFEIMKVEIGFKHAEMKSEDANDRTYYAGLLFFGFNARVWIFIQLKILLPETMIPKDASAKDGTCDENTWTEIQ